MSTSHRTCARCGKTFPAGEGYLRFLPLRNRRVCVDQFSCQQRIRAQAYEHQLDRDRQYAAEGREDFEPYYDEASDL